MPGEADATDSGGGVVEGDGAIAALEEGFEHIAEGGGAGGVPAIINIHVEGEGV